MCPAAVWRADISINQAYSICLPDMADMRRGDKKNRKCAKVVK